MMNQYSITQSNDRHLAKLPAKADLRPQCVVVANLSALVSIPHAACCVVDCLPLVQPLPTPDNSAWASAHSGLRTFSACGCCLPVYHQLGRAEAPTGRSATGHERFHHQKTYGGTAMRSALR